MELTQVIEYIKNPEKVLAVQDQEAVIDWTTHWIYELELEVADMDFQLDIKLAALADRNSIARAEVLLKLDPLYQERKKKELTLKSLKSYRQNVRRKRDRIIPR